ncbi:MAG: glycosyltransferase family 39 protein [Bacteroidales bacterium]|nr:glycosyltransferase family 39 protein [Bacteroidales bacterium]MCM1205827.1 glycosyltransferase family 39 protein [Bacillota bacterium]
MVKNKIYRNILGFVQCNYIYITVSAIALILNLLTIHNHLPWVDEVMFTDSPANFLMYGEWRTHSWYRMGEYSPFSFYVPLYQWLLFCWIKLFGFSLVKVRLFELLTTVVLGWIVIKTVEALRGHRNNNAFLLTFSVLFWFFKGMCTTYRLGRVDMLVALMATVCLYYVVTYWKTDRGIIGLIVFSALTMLAGIQGVIWLASAFVFSLFVIRPYRKLLKVAVYSTSGFSVGFTISCLWMWVHNSLPPFWWNTFGYSYTLLRVKDFIKIHVMGMVVITQEQAQTSATLISKILEVFAEPSMALLMLTAVLLLFVNIPIRSLKSSGLTPPINLCCLAFS